jgi:hypothetical protein
MMTMTANMLLEDSLDKLAAKLGELASDRSSEVQRIRDVLTAIDARGTEAKAFRGNLRELAEAVIYARTSSGNPAGNPALRDLPIPPYDLWLPFKAKDLTPSDPKDLDGAVQIWNKKVRVLAEPIVPPQTPNHTSEREETRPSAERERR